MFSAKSLVLQGHFLFENESNEEIEEKQISLKQCQKENSGFYEPISDFDFHSPCPALGGIERDETPIYQRYRDAYEKIREDLREYFISPGTCRCQKIQ